MRLGLIIVAGIGTLTAALGQTAPACQSRALNTLRNARLEALRGSQASAEQLLRQADAECGTSSAVLSEISSIYQLLGNAALAAVYSKNAGAAGAQGLTVSTPAANQEKSVVREKFALIVGIGKFAQQDRIPGLKFAAKDARDFAAALVDSKVGRFHPENVKVLTDEEATAQKIRSALAEIAQKALKDDLVVLYFSTHGSSPSMDKSKIGSGYLITYDANVNDLYATAFGMDDLANFIRQKLRAERIVTFLDTCYSGDTNRILAQSDGSKRLEVVAIPDQSIAQVAQGKGSVVITSSGSNELSWESNERENSFFTIGLLESLRDHQGLGNVKTLFTEIQRKIPAAVSEYTRSRGLGEGGKGAKQTPGIFPISEIPDIVIGAPTL